MMCSACSGSVMRPTAAVGMLASVRMAEAKGTWKFGLASILAQAQINQLDAHPKAELEESATSMAVKDVVVKIS